jgi:hypothetical protein
VPCSLERENRKRRVCDEEGVIGASRRSWGCCFGKN